jgi:hypothetical protein
LESQVILKYGENIYEFSEQKGQQKLVFRILHKGVFHAYESITVKVSILYTQSCKSHNVFVTVFHKAHTKKKYPCNRP